MTRRTKTFALLVLARDPFYPLIPTKVGTQDFPGAAYRSKNWVPTFVGMSGGGC